MVEGDGGRESGFEERRSRTLNQSRNQKNRSSFLLITLSTWIMKDNVFLSEILCKTIVFNAD